MAVGGFTFTVMMAAALAAHAQDDPRPAAAKAACAAGRVEEAIGLLARLHAEDREVIWVYNQARCYQLNGHREPALARFEEFLRKASALPPSERPEETMRTAETHIAALRSPPVPARRWPRMGVLALGGVGAAGLLGGLVLSFKVAGDEAAVERDGREQRPIDGQRLAAGRRAETWQWICYGVGASALLAGFALHRFAGGEPAETERALSLTPLFAPAALGAAARGSF